MTRDINVKLIDFPETEPKEFVSVNSDGSYTIFLNAKHSHEVLQKAYIHALSHITENDFEKLEDVQSIEWNAHNRAI